jgi:hypothetical protein
MMVSLGRRKALHEPGIPLQDVQHETAVMLGRKRGDRCDLVQHLLAMGRPQQFGRLLQPHDVAGCLPPRLDQRPGAGEGSLQELP